MANLSAIKLPNGTTYNLKDTVSGYTTNQGTVTSVGISGSGGITVSNSPVTSNGTITIGLNLSTAINGLGEGTSPAQRADYIVAQYAGGGTSTTTYHRRSLANIFAALNKSDITNALGATSTGTSTTGVTIAAHATGTVIGVQSTTTTASKVTVGSHSTDYGVKSAGSASTWAFEDIACDDITSWSAGSGSSSLTFAMDTTDTKKLKITFSHSHTAPSLGYTARTASHVKSGGNGSAPTLGSKVPTVSASDITVPIKNTSASTFVTGTTHTVTDGGHSHTI